MQVSAFVASPLLAVILCAVVTQAQAVWKRDRVKSDTERRAKKSEGGQEQRRDGGHFLLWLLIGSPWRKAINLVTRSKKRKT